MQDLAYFWTVEVRGHDWSSYCGVWACRVLFLDPSPCLSLFPPTLQIWKVPVVQQTVNRSVWTSRTATFVLVIKVINEEMWLICVKVSVMVQMSWIFCDKLKDVNITFLPTGVRSFIPHILDSVCSAPLSAPKPTSSQAKGTGPSFWCKIHRHYMTCPCAIRLFAGLFLVGRYISLLTVSSYGPKTERLDGSMIKYG